MQVRYVFCRDDKTDNKRSQCLLAKLVIYRIKPCASGRCSLFCPAEKYTYRVGLATKLQIGVRISKDVLSGAAVVGVVRRGCPVDAPHIQVGGEL